MKRARAESGDEARLMPLLEAGSRKRAGAAVVSNGHVDMPLLSTAACGRGFCVAIGQGASKVAIASFVFYASPFFRNSFSAPLRRWLCVRVGQNYSGIGRPLRDA